MIKFFFLFAGFLSLFTHADEAQQAANSATIDTPTVDASPSQAVTNAVPEVISPSSSVTDTSVTTSENEIKEKETKEGDKEENNIVVEKDTKEGEVQEKGAVDTQAEKNAEPSLSSSSDSTNVNSAEAPSTKTSEKVNNEDVVTNSASAPTIEAQAEASSVPRALQGEDASSSEPSVAATAVDPPSSSSSSTPSDDKDRTAPENNNPPLSHLDDDYYGLLQNPADHLDRAAFQPSHTFVLSLDPGETLLLFEDVANMNVGKVVRGSWFLTNGNDVKVTVSESSQGSVLYSSSSPLEQEQKKEGSFRFSIPRAGKLTISLENPSSSPCIVSFAWLLGADDDDPFVGKRSLGRQGGGEKEGGGLASKNNKGEDGTENNDATSFTQSMLKRVSTLHKDIDDVTSLQQFADVRFARHLETVESNKRRLLWWTVAETIVILLSSALHVIVVQHVFDYKIFKKAFV
jgi:hypothetical protein